MDKSYLVKTSVCFINDFKCLDRQCDKCSALSGASRLLYEWLMADDHVKIEYIKWGRHTVLVKWKDIGTHGDYFEPRTPSGEYKSRAVRDTYQRPLFLWVFVCSSSLRRWGMVTGWKLFQRRTGWHTATCRRWQPLITYWYLNVAPKSFFFFAQPLHQTIDSNIKYM